MSTSTDHLVTQASPGERRFYPRTTPTRLIYIGFGANNTGMLLNIGENGLMVSTPIGLKVNSAYHVSIRLNGIPNPIEVNVCVIWTTESGRRSGIQMLELSDFDREQIRKWSALESAAREKGPEPLASAVAAGPKSDESREPSSFVRSEGTFSRPPRADESERVAPPAAKRPEPPPARAFASQPVFAQKPKTHLGLAADPAGAELAPPSPRQLDFPPSHHLAAIQRTRRKSNVPALVSWGLLGATVCGAAAVFFVPSLSQKFLTPLGLFATAPTTSYLPAPPPQSPRPAALKASQGPLSNGRMETAYNGETAARPNPKPFGSKLAASRPLRQSLESNGNTSDADASTSAPDFTASEAAADAAGKVTPAAAPTQPAAPTPAPPASSQATVTANPQLGIRPASVPPSSSAAPSRSAITGSIVGSGSQPTSLSAVNPTPSNSANNAGTSLSASRTPASAGRSSFFHPNSDRGVVNMDPGEDTVTEITPPRGLMASFMNLPGERVLESPGITMHIERSVRVPADRWIILREHKKLMLGRLTSRVDPQTAYLPPGSGTLTVEANIDKDGRVTGVKPVNGASVFLPAVTRAVRQWHYEPTYIDNKPAETRAQIEFNFHPQSVRATRP